MVGVLERSLSLELGDIVPSLVRVGVIGDATRLPERDPEFE
jgi:hypothetical protein